MNYNYHNHTKRCGHAWGEVEEYIQRAIEGKIKYMGFSDHSPFKFPDGYESDFRVPVAEATDYVNEIKELREKYKGKIDIKIGFEMEYYPEYFDDMLKTAKDAGAEYLIFGPHFIEPDCLGVPHAFGKTEDVDFFNRYVENVIGGMKTGVFTYVAHPDMISFVGDEEVYNEGMRKICTISKELNVPLEINCQGMRYGRSYPNERFWKIAGEVGCPVTAGFDAHGFEAAWDEESIPKVKELVEKYNLNYIGKPTLKGL